MTRKPRSHVTTLMYRTWAINFYLLSRHFRLFLLKETRGEFWEGGATVPHIACIASVCVWFQSKGKLRNNEEWDFWFWPQEKWNKSQKYNMKEGGGRGEGPYPSPLINFTHPTLRAVFDSRSLFLAPKLTVKVFVIIAALSDDEE